MKIKYTCCSVESGSIVARCENGKRFQIVNGSRKQIKVCRVDGCMLTGATKRCDALFIVENEKLYLVEFKGRDHTRALLQILETAEELGITDFVGLKHSVIVCSASPKISTKYQNMQLRLFKRFQSVGLEFPIKKTDRYSCEV